MNVSYKKSDLTFSTAQDFCLSKADTLPTPDYISLDGYNSIEVVSNDNIENSCINSITLVEKARLRLSYALDNLGGVRINQLLALQALKAKLSDPNWNLAGYMVQPTGAGKTVLFGHIIKSLDMNTIVLVPKTNLLEQTKAELVNVVGIPADQIGLVGNGHSQIDRPIIISTYQSHIANYKKKNDYRTKIASTKLLICDEAHRSLGDITRESIDGIITESADTDCTLNDLEISAQKTALSQANKQFGGNIIKLAFTATPKLAEKSVREVFGEHEISRETYANLIQSGILVPFRIFHTDGRIFIGQDFKESQSITQEEESKILAREKTYNKLLDIFAKLYKGNNSLKTAAFCSSIAECDKFIEIAENEYHLKCIRVTSKDDAESLQEAEAGLLSGSIQIIVTVDKLTEGWNFPALDTIIIARATNSPARLLQGVGRASRTSNGKLHANIIETNWQVGRLSTDQTDSGKGGVGLAKPAKQESDEFIVKRALNLIEALLTNGELPENLGIICRDESGSEIVYQSQKQLIIDGLKEQFTPQSWAAMKGEAKLQYKFQPGNLGLTAIASKLGIQGNPVNNHPVMLEIGKKIWGDLDCFKQLSLEDLINGLKEQFTPQSWAAMKGDAKLEYKFQPGNLGLTAIASKLGIKGDPINQRADMMELGKKIWGDHKCFEYEEKAEVTVEELVKGIKDQFSPEAWANMTQPIKAKYKFQPGNLGLVAITSKLGVNGNPVNNHPVMLEIGKKIWGDLDCFKLSLEDLINGLKEQFTPQSWAAMKKEAREKYKFQPGNLGLKTIATKLGMNAKPVGNHADMLELGKKIWGDHKCFEYEEKVEVTVEEIIEGLKAQFNPETWSAMTTTAKEQYKFQPGNLGLGTIATRLGLKGRPVGSHSDMMELGKKIWGDHKCFEYEEKVEVTVEELVKGLKQEFTPESWVSMKQKAAYKFQPGNLGLYAIASKFGIKGNPIKNKVLMLELARMIWAV